MSADGSFIAPQAPYYDTVADGPEGGYAVWLTATDGIRLRVVGWGSDAENGTILLFPGRTEYAEKYGRAAAEMAARGYGTLAIDWRGQGIADRLLANRAIGHVNRFHDYQYDVAAMLEYARAKGLPEPFYLLAHSMGGCIGLRALHDGLPVIAAGFTAPMWGIQMAPRMRPVAWVLSSLSRPLGLSGRRSPGQLDETYVLRVPFEGNTLTTDPEHWSWMQAHLRDVPDLSLGGASLGWLNEALREMRALAHMPSPRVPCLTALGSREAIVDPARIRTRMAAWDNSELWLIEGAEHEIMMEHEATRTELYDRLDRLFSAARDADQAASGISRPAP